MCYTLLGIVSPLVLCVCVYLLFACTPSIRCLCLYRCAFSNRGYMQVNRGFVEPCFQRSTNRIDSTFARGHWTWQHLWSASHSDSPTLPPWWPYQLSCFLVGPSNLGLTTNTTWCFATRSVCRQHSIVRIEVWLLLNLHPRPLETTT